MKINLGAGKDILPGFINHDLTNLPGIQVVHDLNQYPWPWKDNVATEIKVHDVLEHLQAFLKAMEEIHRILLPGGLCHISVPYWNSWCAHSDPTHVRSFHETTFCFFDPSTSFCQSRPYYTKARFKIISEKLILAPFSPYFSLPGINNYEVENKALKKIIGLVGNYFISNLIHGLHLTLQKEKTTV